MKIMVGLVAAPEGRAALERAIDEAALRGAELLIVRHVRVESREDVSDKELGEVRSALEQAAAEAAERDVTCSTDWSVGAGSAGDELVRIAKRQEVDLIVIGMRRRSRVGKIVLGSDAQDILLGSDAAVLCVKASKDADAAG